MKAFQNHIVNVNWVFFAIFSICYNWYNQNLMLLITEKLILERINGFIKYRIHNVSITILRDSYLLLVFENYTIIKMYCFQCRNMLPLFVFWTYAHKTMLYRPVTGPLFWSITLLNNEAFDWRSEIVLIASRYN